MIHQILSHESRVGVKTIIFIFQFYIFGKLTGVFEQFSYPSKSLSQKNGPDSVFFLVAFDPLAAFHNKNSLQMCKTVLYVRISIKLLKRASRPY